MAKKNKNRRKNEQKENEIVQGGEPLPSAEDGILSESLDERSKTVEPGGTVVDDALIQKLVLNNKLDEAVDYLLLQLLCSTKREDVLKVCRYIIDLGTRQDLKDPNILMIAVNMLSDFRMIDAAVLGVLKDYFEKRKRPQLAKRFAVEYAIANEDSKELLDVADKAIKTSRVEALSYFLLAGIISDNIMALEKAESLAIELSMFETAYRIITREENLIEDKQLYANKLQDFLSKTVDLPMYLNLNRKVVESLSTYRTDSRQLKRFQSILSDIENNPQSILSNLKALAIEQKDRISSARIYINIAYLLMHYFGESHVSEIDESLSKAFSLNPVSYSGLKLVYEYCVKFGRMSFSNFIEREMANIKIASMKVDFLLLSLLFNNSTVADIEQMITLLREIQKENSDSLFLNSLLGESAIEKEDYVGAIKLYSMCIPLLKSDEEKIRYYELLGRLSDAASNFEDAYINYLKVLNINGPSLHLLRSILKVGKKANITLELADIYFYISFFLQEGDEKVDALIKSCELYLAKGDLQNAFRAFKGLFRISPTNRMVVTFIDEMIAKGVPTRNIVDVILPFVDEISYVVKDKFSLIPLYKKISSLLHKNLNDVDNAIKYYKLILSIDPEDIETVKVLSSIAMATQAIDDVEAALRKEIELLSRLSDKIAALKRLAQIKEERRQDYTSAISVYKEILAADPSDEFSKERLKLIYKRLRQKDDYAALMLAEIDAASHINEKNRKRVELAEYLLLDFDAYEESLAIIMDVYRSDSSNEDVFRILGLFAEKNLLLDKIAPVYKPYLLDKGDYQTWIRLVEAEIKTESDPEKRMANLKQLAQIYGERLNHQDLAFNTRIRLFREAPSDKENIDILIKMSQEVRGEEELANNFLEKASEEKFDNELRIVLLRYAADIYEKRLNNISGVKKALYILSNFAGNDIDVLNRLIKLASESSDYPALADSLFKRAAIQTNNEDKIRDLTEAARIFEVEIKDDMKAIEALRKVLEIDENNLPVMRRLDRLLERNSMWEPLVDVLLKEISVISEPIERSQLYQRLGDLYLERLERDTDAINAYQEAFKANIVSDTALSKLIGLFSEVKDFKTIYSFIEKTYRQHGEWGLLANFYVRTIKTIEDKQYKKDIYFRLAEIYEKEMNQLDLLYSTLCKAMRELPESEDVADRLEQAAVGLNLYEETIEFFDEVAEDERIEPSVRASIYARAARIAHSALGNINRALEYAKKANNLVYGNPEYMSMLEEYQRAAGKYSDLINLYEQKIQLAESEEEKRMIYFEMSEVIEKNMGDIKGAIEVLFELFKKYPRDDEVFERLVELCTKGEEYGVLARVYEKRIEFLEDENLRREQKLNLARLKTERLSDFSGATQIVESLLLEDSKNSEAILLLSQIFESSPEKIQPGKILLSILKQDNQKAAMVRVLDILATCVDNNNEKINYLVNAAEISFELGDKNRGFEFYLKAFSLDYENIHILKKLIEISDSQELWEQVAMVCEEALTNLLTEEAMKFIKKQLADISLKWLSDSERAFSLYKELLLEDMSELDMMDVLSAIEAKYREDDDKVELVGILIRRLKYIQDPKEKIDVLIEIADIQIDTMGRIDTGFETLKQIIDIAPENEYALKRIVEIASQLGRWQELSETLSKLIQIVKDDTELSEYKFELGLLYEERMNDINKAFSYFRESFEHNKDNPVLVRHLTELMDREKYITEVVPLLVDIYFYKGDYEKAVYALEKASKMKIDKAVRFEYMQKVTEIYRSNMGQPEMAFLAIVKILREFPEQTEIFKELEEIADEIGSFEEVVATLEDLYLGVKAKDIKVEYARKLGEIYEQKIKDQEQAMVYFEEVIANLPNDIAALSSLDRIYRLKGEWEKLTSVIEEEIKIVQDEEERINLIFRLAKVLEERLSDAKGAIVCYNRILEIRPDHRLAIRSLEKLYETLKDFNNLKRILEKALELAEDDEERSRIKTRIASILGTKLGDSDRAIDIYKEVFEADNSSDEAFEALEKYYLESQDYTNLVSLYRKYVDAIVDKTKSVPYRLRLADILINTINDIDNGKLVLSDLLAIDPQNIRALLLLRDIYKASGEFVEEAAVLKRLIPLQDDSLKLKEYRLELMELLANELGRREEAIEMSKRVLDIEPHTFEDLERVASVLRSLLAYEEIIPVLELMVDMSEGEQQFLLTKEIADIYYEILKDNRQALQFYEKAFEINCTDREVFDKVVTIERESRRISKLPPFYEKRIQSETDAGIRKSLLRELAEIYEKELDEEEMSFLTWCRVLKEDYEDREVLSKVESLSEKMGLFEELYAVYKEAIDTVENSELQQYFRKRQAELSIGRLGEKEEAERHYKEIIDLNKEDREAYHRLQEIYEQDGRYIDLIDYLDREIQIVSEIDEKIDIYLRIADIYYEKINNPDEASSILKKALALDGSNRRLLEKMIDFYKKAERFEDLAQSIKRMIDISEIEKQTEYYLMLGDVYENRLKKDEKAIEAYLSALDIEPENLKGLKALENIYQRLNMHEELAEIYEREIQILQEPSDIIDIHFKVSSIYEDILSDYQRAIVHYNAVLDIDAAEINAVKGLERCYLNEQNYEYLVDTYKRHLELIDDPEERVEILLKMAVVSRDNLRRADFAETYFTQTLKIDPNNREAIHNLAELYEKSGNWFNAVEMLKREADGLGQTMEAVKIYFRLGKIHEEMLLDLESAKESYKKAIELDPSHIEAVRALRGIYGQEKNLEEYLNIMKHEAKCISDPEEKKRIYFEIGKIYEEEKNDIEQAKFYYEESLKIDFGYVAVAKILADIYFREENWQRAESCLQVVVKDMEKTGEKKEVARQYYRLGYIAEKMNDMQKAIQSYQVAYDMDPTYLPVMESLAIGYTHLEMWEKASAIYQNIIVHQKDVLSDAELVDVYYQVGEIEKRIGNLEKAISFLRKGYEIDERHLKILTLLKEIYSERAEWDDVYDMYLQIISIVPEEQRFDMYMELGDICISRLSDVFRAIDAYSGALRCGKTAEQRQKAMEMLFPLYIDAHQPQKAVAMLKELVSIEKDRDKLKIYYLKLAELNKKLLSNLDEAISYFNKVLDIDPNYTQAFAEIEKILAERRDWKGLEEAYRNMIQRTPKEQKSRRAILWKTLADLYYRALRNPEAAIMAYEVVAGLDKENVEVLDMLAELYSSKEKYRDKAIKAYHQLIKVTTNPVKVCKALKRLYIATKQYDRVYIICNVLKFLKQSEPEDERIISQLRTKLKDVSARSLTENLWEEAILHKQATGVIGAIFSTVLKKYPEMFMSPPEAFGLKKSDYIDINTSQLFVASMLRYVRGVLNVQAIQAYKGQPGISGIRLLPSNPPSLVLGEDMFKERSKKEIWFILAKEMTLIRPEFFVLISKPPEHIEAILSAVLAVANPNALMEGNPALNQEYARLFAPRMTPDNLMVFKALASRYYQEKTRPRIEDFKEGVELSTIRAGVAITQDFEFALNMIQKVPFRVYKIPQRTLLREVVIYYMSEEYMSLREKLGLSVAL